MDKCLATKRYKVLGGQPPFLQITFNKPLTLREGEEIVISGDLSVVGGK